MQYEGIIFRPPSEAESLLVQVTVGCSWNRCTFCDMYTDKKFRVRSLDEIKADLQEGARWRDRIRRIFLCDGDALVVKTADLVEILKTIRQLYPNLEGVRVYASARDILHKPVEDLKLLHRLGLDMAYLGLESGSDRIL
ncbi:MAG TPA: radical SAM protein, partial [Ruminococcaceae bacterium]|nr:radical SAM protein [Oscillospiraceae bacterium]